MWDDTYRTSCAVCQFSAGKVAQVNGSDWAVRTALSCRDTKIDNNRLETSHASAVVTLVLTNSIFRRMAP